MSALPFTPLTITPRATESQHAHSPCQRAESVEAEGWPDSDSPTPFPIFSPDETTTAAILNDFAAQDETLRGIADKYETTLESLTLWLARPDIAHRLHALESACAARARLVVANNLAAIANKLLHLLDEAKLDHESIHRVPATTHHAFAARMQSRESARKTANLLLRLARFTPLNTTPPPPPPTPPLPNTNPTRKRGATAAHLAPPLPAPRGEVPESARVVRGRDAHEPAATIEFTEAPTNPTRKRGATDAPLAPPTRAHRNLPYPPTPSPAPHPPPRRRPPSAPSPVSLAVAASVQAPNHAAGP